MPDMVLLDMMMEGMEGTEVCKIIKNERKTANIPVIAVTVIRKIPGERYQEIIDSGVDGYVEKPFSIEELNIIVKSHLRRK